MAYLGVPIMEVYRGNQPMRVRVADYGLHQRAVIRTANEKAHLPDSTT